MLSHHRYLDICPRPTPCVRCLRLDSKIRAVIPSVVRFPHLGLTSAGVPPLLRPSYFRKFPDETVKTFTLFPRAFVCSLFPVLSWHDTAPFRSWQSLQLPPGFLDSPGGWHVRRKPYVCSFSQSSRLDSARNDMCPLACSGSLRGRSFHAMLNYEGPASLVKLFFTHSSFPCLFHSFRPYIWNTLGRARNVIHLGALSVPSRIFL